MSCVIEHLAGLASYGTIMVPGSPPPSPGDTNDILDFGKCIRKCKDRCQDDNNCDNDDDDWEDWEDYFPEGTINTPWGPMIPDGSPGGDIPLS